MAGGFFLTSREIFKNPIWQDVIKFRIFFYIVGNAVFSEEGVRVGNVVVQRGQYLRSYRNLRQDLEFQDQKTMKMYALATINKKIQELIAEHRLEVKNTDYGTLFTVLNYEQYQGFDGYRKEYAEHSANTKQTDCRTLREHSANNNKQDNKDNKVINKELKEILVGQEPPPEPPPKTPEIPYDEIIGYLNQKAGKNFSPKSTANRELIRARLRDDKFNVEDFYKVIDNKVREWKHSPKMEKFLRPSTLFRKGNFDNYLNEGGEHGESGSDLGEYDFSKGIGFSDDD